MSDTFKDVKAVIMDVMKIDGEGITLDTRFVEDLKADSMDQFFLIDGFCEKFGMNINDEDARTIRTGRGCGNLYRRSQSLIVHPALKHNRPARANAIAAVF